MTMSLDDFKWFKQKIDARMGQFSLLLKDQEYWHRCLSGAIRLMDSSLRKGNKVLVFGNGGSAAQSSHLAAELVNKFYSVRKGLPAIALTTDMANITSIANDSGYEHIFSRQLETLGQEGDTAVGISTSGKSPNVLQAFKSAKQMRLNTIALCGKYTEALRDLDLDVILAVNSGDTPVVQEMHLFILHMMAEVLEENVPGGKD
jgi:D-sedoheptulose 7-phosphate isomerase